MRALFLRQSAFYGLATCLVENGDEAVNIVERIVQWCWRNPENIRFSLVDNDTAFLNVMLHLVEEARVQKNAELRAALSGIRWCNDFVWWFASVVLEEAGFEVRSQFQTALSLGFHVCHGEDI